MNNKGQSLVFLIIIMPIIFLIVGFAIEIVNVYYQKHHVLSITKTVIKKSIDAPSKDDIIRLYDDNNIDYDTLDINLDDGILINITVKVDSFLGKVLGKDYYLLKLSVHGVYKENKVVYQKGKV